MYRQTKSPVTNAIETSDIRAQYDHFVRLLMNAETVPLRALYVVMF